jgi:predicted transcriptional regulator
MLMDRAAAASRRIVSACVTAETAEQLRRLAAQQDRSLSAVIRRALVSELARDREAERRG